MPFEPGQSGNPGGRPRGSRNRRTMAAEKLLDENAERIMQRVINMAADDGDKMMLRVCMDRIVPRAKQSPVAFQLPPVATPTDAIKAMSTIVQGIADGELTPIEAAELSVLVRLISQVASESDIEHRLKQQEEITAKTAGKAK
jgi:hypothetical protein